MSLPELLYQNATVYTLINISDGFGTYINTTSQIYPNIICRKNLKNVTKKLANGKIKTLPNLYKIFIQDNLNISEKDMIYLNGNYYDILHIYPVYDSNTFNHLEILVKLIENFTDNCYLLNENGDGLLFENGELILLENC